MSVHRDTASTDSDETSVEALAATPAADGPDVPALSDSFVPFADIPDCTGPIVTLRAAVVGVLCGVLVNASNIYIGLRAGWTTSANVLGVRFTEHFLYSHSSCRKIPTHCTCRL